MFIAWTANFYDEPDSSGIARNIKQDKADFFDGNVQNSCRPTPLIQLTPSEGHFLSCRFFYIVLLYTVLWCRYFCIPKAAFLLVSVYWRRYVDILLSSIISTKPDYPMNKIVFLHKICSLKIMVRLTRRQ